MAREGGLSESVALLATPRAIPNESNPGPTLAVVPGMLMVTEVEGFFREDVMVETST
jgi:hypothetical protein